MGISYEVSSGRPPQVHITLDETHTLTLHLPTTSTLELKEFITHSGHSSTIYKVSDMQSLASDLGLQSDPSVTLLLEFDTDTPRFKIFSTNESAGKHPLAITTTLIELGLSTGLSSNTFQVTFTTDALPTCRILKPDGRSGEQSFYFMATSISVVENVVYRSSWYANALILL